MHRHWTLVNKHKVIAKSEGDRAVARTGKKVHRLSNIGSSIHFGASELEVGYWKGLRPFRSLLIHVTERRWKRPLCNLR